MFCRKSLLKTINVMNNYEIVRNFRWSRTRKPFWLGTAKSKMFIVKEKEKIPELEKKELVELERHYNIFLKSLAQFIENNYDLKSTEDKKSVENASNSIRNDCTKNCLEANKIWNSESAELRRLRLKIWEDSAMDETLTEIKCIDDVKKQLHEKIEKIVTDEKEKSQYYVTFDKLDEEVTKCLNKIAEYNFAIDIFGNKYIGREPFCNFKFISK